MGLYKLPNDFDEFNDPSYMPSDELCYKLMTAVRHIDGSLLHNYLINRSDDDFFTLKDWPKIASLKGYKSLKQSDT